VTETIKPDKATSRDVLLSPLNSLDATTPSASIVNFGISSCPRRRALFSNTGQHLRADAPTVRQVEPVVSGPLEDFLRCSRRSCRSVVDLSR
jgi:hypothetical protein